MNPVPDAGSAAAYLIQALEEEAAGNWLHSHVLCERALARSPEDPGALNLLGRLSGIAGDSARAIALQSFVLHLDPAHPRARADLETARAAILSPSEAARLFEEVLRIEPEVACYRHSFPSLVPFAGIDRVDALLRECVRLDPGNARAHAALANVRVRRKATLAAIEAYSIAVMLDWAFADAHLALADVLDAIREEAMAMRHRRAALEGRRFFAASATAQTRVLVLATAGGIVANVPLDLVVNPSRVALHRYFLTSEEEAQPELPPYDLVFNGIEELESSASSIERAARFVDAAAVPVLNHPRAAARTRRSHLSGALAGIAGVTVPATRRASRGRLLERATGGGGAVEGVPFPLLIRPVDSHRGDGLERIESEGGLREYVARSGADGFYLVPFVDYRSADGYYRKYRTIVVDGVPYPYHLAVSDRWMVHYAGSLMDRHAWMRAEEERFLAEPSSVFAAWGERFGAIAGALGLQYFGVDCALAPDGSILVFECNAGMLVHCTDDPELFAYKYRYVPRIFDAVDRLLTAPKLDKRALAANEPA
jgi:tetratricopeptide (TPR) repeat protein